MKMAEFCVRDSLPADVRELEKDLRHGDRLEITCTGIPVRRALWRSFRRSIIARTALVDGEVAVMGGVSGCALSGEGRIWLLTTHAVEKMPLSFVKHARRELVDALMIFPKVNGLVDASYIKAVRFLALLGFTLSDPMPSTFGPHFRQFTMER